MEQMVGRCAINSGGTSDKQYMLMSTITAAQFHKHLLMYSG